MKRHLSAWIALAVGLVLTMVASLEVKKAIEQDAAEELAFTSDQVTLKIQERLDAYALILKGGAGLFAASNAVGRREWQAYVEKLRSQDSVPGVQGIGFSQVIPPQQLATHIGRIRAEGFPDYTVRPAGERALYTSIIYLEPFRDRNLRAFGFDMFSEPVRRAAMEQARDSGAPALSGKVELVQETATEVQAGTLMYVPVYRNGAPTDTVEQRRAALIGWSYSPYRMQDLLDGILTKWADHKTKRVHLQIYAGLEVQADSLLYDSHPTVIHKIDPLLYQQRTIDFNGQHWLLAFHPYEGVVPLSYASAWATLVGGIVLSSLLCGLMLTLARTQVRAREIADNLTEELRKSERFLRTTIDGLSAHIAVLDDRGAIILTNKAYRDFGARNGIEPRTVSEGGNYLAVCDAASGVRSAEATPFAKGIREVIAGKRQSFELEYPCHSPDEERWFIAHVTPFDDAGPRQVIVAHENITERKRAEAAVTRSAEEGKILLNTIQTQIWYLTNDHTYGAVNQAHAEFNGLKIEDMAFKNMYDFYPKAAVEVCRQSNVEVFTTGKSVHSEEWVPHFSGKLRLISILKTPRLRADGTVEYVVCAAEDITERRQAEESLRQAGEILKTMQMGLYVYELENPADDSSLRMVAANAASGELTGVPPEESIGKYIDEIFPALRALGIPKRFADTVHTGKTREFEDFYYSDGRVLETAYAVKAFPLPNHRVGITFDSITARKRAEEALRASEDKFRSIFASMTEMVVLHELVCDEDGRPVNYRILDCNPAFTQITGIRRDDAVGRLATDVYGSDTAPYLDEYARVALTGEPCTFTATYAPMDKHFDVHLASPGKNRFVTVTTDISERKRAETKLLELKMAVEQSGDGIALADMDEHIIFVNQAWAEMHGYAAEELIGQHLSVFHTPAQLENEVIPFNGRLIATGSNTGELGHCRKDGTTFIAQMAVTVVKDTTDTPFRLLAAARDITERKRNEAELDIHRHHLETLVEERTEELTDAKVAAEAANRAKSLFLANMSHELRTPMNGVLGMIDIAKRRMADPKGLDFLNKAKLSADRLLGVLNDILDISKIEAERMVFESIPLQLSAVVENLTSTLGHKVTEKGLLLETDLPAELAYAPLKGDPLRLGQILFNLVGNAIKFTERGSITLRVRQVDDSSSLSPSVSPLPNPFPQGERATEPEQRAPDTTVLLRFEVVDTGIGIEPEAQTRLFQSFEQADNSMTRKYGGTGLGLAICKRLMQLMGGEIGVESTLGQGSTFWFVVPLNKREADAIPPAPTFTALTAEQRLQADYAGTRILLAEDEPITQEISRGLLEDVGLVVDLAEDGRQALELAQQNTYALILMDMQMPNLNGIDATQAIRADSLNMATPILAMTANAFDEDRQVCLDAGMNDHIAKPVDPDRLYETLLAWLEKRGG